MIKKTLLPVILGALVAMGLAAPAVATTPGHNGRIAFKRYLETEGPTVAIFTVRADGTDERQLTFPDFGTIDDQPDWSPDGSLVAFERCVADAACADYTVRPDGSQLRRLTAPCSAPPGGSCADESDVAFMPDGRHVVFTRASGSVRAFPNGEDWIEHSDLVISNLAGTRSRVVLASQPFSGDNGQVVASPDGRRLAFVRHNSPQSDPVDGEAIFVVGVDGKGLRQLTPWSSRAGDHPDWSPDGRWILFRSPDSEDFLNSQLYVIHPNGRGLRQVTDVRAGDQVLSASFSPDGRKIVYAQTGTDGRPDIFTLPLNGGDPTPVTRSAVRDSAPDWGPRPCRRGWSSADLR